MRVYHPNNASALGLSDSRTPSACVFPALIQPAATPTVQGIVLARVRAEFHNQLVQMETVATPQTYRFRCLPWPCAALETRRDSFARLTASMWGPLRSARLLLKMVGCLVVFSACNLSTPAPPTPLPSATPAIPQVQILYPPHNQRVVEGIIFDIDILASDPATGIQRVELYVDEELLQSSETETQHQQSYRIATNWLAKGIGWHKFSAIAYRADGTASHPHVIALEVVPQS